MASIFNEKNTEQNERNLLTFCVQIETLRIFSATCTPSSTHSVAQTLLTTLYSTFQPSILLGSFTHLHP